MKKYLQLISRLLFFTCVLAIPPVLAQQHTPGLSTVDVNQLSDAQIQEMLQRARASGQTDAQLLETARSQGMSDTQIQNLQARIASLNSSAPAKTYERSVRYDSTAMVAKSASAFDPLVPRIFGSDLFSGQGSSFEPNLRIATPVNYIIGPGDQLNINIFGNSVDNWKLDVSPEGSVNVPHVGVISVSGKTIEAAKQTITKGLIAHNYKIGQGTTMELTLGDIRSIKVIITGEVTKPGSYTLSSLSTVFNALYAAGGPNLNGSFRQIEIIRDNHIIRKLDIYNFLLKSDLRDNIGLKDQDIIRIPNYSVRVELAGEVNHPALFEVLPGETLQDVLRFAGGFTVLAYRDKIQVLQIADNQRSISDISRENFQTYIPQSGDKFVVSKILERYKNRVTINGAVTRPGSYQLDDHLTLSGLIAKASGLRPDAFLPRGTITRLNSDNTTEILSFDVKGVAAHTAPDIILQREDLVSISSIFDFHDPFTVTIKGEVRAPGEFAYADSLTLENLIIKAGGLATGATTKRIEVSRRVDNSDPNSLNGTVSKVFSVDVTDQLGLNSTNFQLKPFDIVSVYSSPGYEKQRTIKVEGEVFYPGFYTIQTKNERISDIIKRAGGLTPSAYVEGGTLKRENSASLGYDKSKVDTTTLLKERQARINKINGSVKDSTRDVSDEPMRNTFVGIDLQTILKSPGSRNDLIMQDGDVLRIPGAQQTVTINGEVLFPSSIVYGPDKSFKDYVLNAGGFSDQALVRKSYILYPNGTVQGTHKFLFFNVFPNVKPGSEIYVPKKHPKGNFLGSALGVTSALASIGVLILGIITLSK